MYRGEGTENRGMGRVERAKGGIPSSPFPPSSRTLPTLLPSQRGINHPSPPLSFPDSSHTLTGLQEVAALAREAAGNATSGFAAVQLPVGRD